MKSNELTLLTEKLGRLNEEEPIELEALQGFQSHNYYWSIIVPMAELGRYFRPYFENRLQPVDRTHPLAIAQRSLNFNRVRKLMNYILNGALPNQHYVIPPLMVTVDIPEGESVAFESVEYEDSTVESRNGTLILPGSAKFWLPDGQTRAIAAIAAALEAEELVKNETVCLMLTLASGDLRKKIFLDINKNASKPSQSIIALFDHEDPTCELARILLTRVEIFKGRTALEKTVAKGADLFTMNSLKECAQILMGGLSSFPDDAIAFFEMLAAHHPHWKQVGQTDIEPIRNETISFHAITVAALAKIAVMQFEDDPSFHWGKSLDRFDWRISNPQLDGVIYFNGKIIKNKRTVTALADYIIQDIGLGEK